MHDALIKAATQAIEIAKVAGAQDCSARTTRNQSSEFRVRKGELEKAQQNTQRSLSLSIYADGRYSSHSTTDLRPDRLKAFVTEAVAMTRALEQDPHRTITDPSLFANIPTDDLDLIDPEVQALTAEKRLELLKEIEASALGHDRVISVEAQAYDGHSLGAAVSSNGFSGTWEGTSLWLGTKVAIQDEGDRRPQQTFFVGSPYLSDLPAPSDLGTQALNFSIERLGSTKGPTTTTTMVVHPRSAARLIGNLVRPNRARAIQQSSSFWSDLKDSQAFTKHLTLIDMPLLPRGLASRHFDGEGIAARQLPIVEEGVVKNFYVDTYYGKKGGMEPTTAGPSNLIVAPGNRDLSGIVADLEDGMLITGWLGGNSDATTGEFSMGCQGHLIEGGKIGAPVHEMNVTGNLLELFTRLIEVGNDPWPYGSTLAPTLVFDAVQFSGA